MRGWLILVLLTVFFVQIPYSSAGGLTGLPQTVMLYNFNDTLEDEIGDYLWVLQAGSTDYQLGHEEGDSAVYFDDIVWYRNNNSVTHDNGKNMSTELVFNCNNSGVRGDVFKFDSGTPKNDLLVLPNGSLQITIRDDSSNVDDWEGGVDVCDGFWHYLVWQLNVPDDVFQVFYDGSLVHEEARDVIESINATANFVALGATVGGAFTADELLVSALAHHEDLYFDNSFVSDRYDSLFSEETFDLEDRMYVYWRLEEDKSEYQTEVGDQTIYNLSYDTIDPIRVDGIQGFGQEFNGTSAVCLSCSKLDTVDRWELNNTAYSISLWFKTTDLGHTSYLFEHDGGVDKTMGLLFQDEEVMEFVNKHNQQRIDSVNLSDFGFDPDDGSWHNIIGVYNANTVNNSANRVLYFDSVKVSESAWETQGTIGGLHRDYTTIGGRSFDNTSGFNGVLDEIVLWKDRAITEDEVDVLYNDGLGRVLGKSEVSIFLYNRSTSAVLDDYNVSWVARQGNDVVDSGFFLGSPMVFFLDNGTYDIELEIQNITDFERTVVKGLNATGGVVSNAFFYDFVRVDLWFYDLVSGGLLTDNVSVSVIDGVVYENYSSSGSLTFHVLNDFYDIIAENQDEEEYGMSELFSQNLSNLSTVSGTAPFINLSMFFFNNSGSGANNITATIYNQIASPLEGAVLQIQRRNSDGNFVLIQQVESNFEGQTRFQANLNTDFYKFLIYYEGELKFISNATRLYSSTVNFFISTADFPGSAFFLLNDFNHQLTFNDDTNLASLIWTGLTGLNNRICLNATKTDGRGFKTRLNSSCSTGVSGTISFVVLNQTEKTVVDIQAYLYTETGSEEKNLLDGKSIYFSGQDVTGKLGLFLSVFLVIAVSLGLGWKNPGIIPVAATGTLFFCGLIGLHIMSVWLTGTLFFLGIVISVWVSDKV